MVYSFIVDATGRDLGRIRRGMQRLSELADMNGVPITWALDSRTARSAASWLNSRAQQRDQDTVDGLVLMLNTAAWREDEEDDNDEQDLHIAAERLVRRRETYPDRIAQERDRVCAALPWARIAVAGAEMKDVALVHALEQLDVHGLWGYRWNEASRRAQDRGCPFGFFYVSRERYQSAGPPITTIVGVPRETGDLSFWRRIPPEPPAWSPVLFEEQPETPEVPSSPTGDIEMTARALRWIADASALNEWNAVTHPLSAEGCADLSDADAARLIDLWTLARESAFEAVRLEDAVEMYRESFPETEPTVFLCRSEGAPRSDQGDANGVGPWELFYYDARAQFVFDEATSEPADIFNYATPSSTSKYLAEYELPTVASFVPERARERLRLEFEVDSPKPMPYALLLWEDHRHLRVVDTNVLDVRWIDRRGILVHMALETGRNEFSLVLTI